MTDTANVVYGRLKEAMYLSGHAFGRGGEWLETLLADDAWRTVGPGFGDINEFLRSIDLSPFALDNKPGLIKRIKELQPDASNVAIGKAIGSSEGTVRYHLRDEPEPSQSYEPELIDTPSDLRELSEPSQSYEPDPDIEDDEPEWFDQPESAPEPEPVAPSSSKSTRDLLAQSDENEWYTPRRFTAAAAAVLGAIDLDPASSPTANEIVGATRIYTIHDNGLEHPWKGTVWLNPPYGGENRLFVERLIREYEAGNVTAAITLVNCHPAETQWFQRLFDYTVCFVRGRIDFTGPARDRASTSTHGSAIAYLGADWQAFASEFSRFGAVVRRV